MKTYAAHRYTVLAAAAGFLCALSLPAAADEPLDDLDAPMAVFDDVSLVPAALARMPLPAANPAGAAYNDAADAGPSEVDEGYGSDDGFGDDRSLKLQVQFEFEQDLVENVREGYRAPQEFEGLDRREERLGLREDQFHIEEGEDVDVEDGFNDEDEAVVD